MDDRDYIIYFVSGVLALWIIVTIISCICKCTRKQSNTSIKSEAEQTSYGKYNQMCPECCEHITRFNEAESKWNGEKTTLQTELKEEKQEKEKALSRLNKITASRLKDGNPNIVDLNDQNRPEKIGKQFSELYDNQWINAYDSIENYFGKSISEPVIIQILLEIFKKCFMECKAISQKQINQLSVNVTFIAALITKDHHQISSDLMQRLKEDRKRFATGAVPELKAILPALKGTFSAKNKDPRFLDEQPLIEYIQECQKISWLMMIQDPPMTIAVEPDIDTYEQFNAYKTGGKLLKYTVWPALLLFEGGPMVTKGVAEFTAET